jgi:hypothetical protein
MRGQDEDLRACRCADSSNIFYPLLLVKKALFSTYCTTCHARIAVLQTEAIGKILDCPKCGSMVQIVPPEGWSPPGAAWAGTLPNLQKGPPPLNKVSETYLALDTANAAAEGSLTERLLALLKARAIWIGWAVGAAVMLSAIVMVWINTANRRAASPGDDNASVNPVDAKSPGAVLPSGAKNPDEGKNPGEVQKPETAPEKPKPLPAENHVRVEPLGNPPHPDPLPKGERNAGNAPQPKPVPKGEGNADNAPQPDPLPKGEGNAKEPVKPAPSLPESSAARLVKMVAPEPFDLDQRLGVVLPDVELKEMPLARALALAATLGNVPLTIDPDALRLTGVSPRDPVSLHLRGSSVQQLFEAVAEKRGLGVDTEADQVTVALSTEDREKLRPVRYKVNDLCADEKLLGALAALIQKVIAPTTWQDGGGDGTIKTENDALLVTQSGAVHHEVLIFCEKLRLARGLPLRSKFPPSRFALPARLAQAKSLLGHKVSANFHEPAPLAQILGELAGQADADLLIDRRALAEDGMSDATEVAYTVADKPLGASLGELLHSLKLDFRPIDATTIQVSTPRALQACRELEFYPVGQLLGKDGDAAKLIGRIKREVAPDSWKTAGRTVAIEYDAPSQTLIVRQSPAVQASLEWFLSQKDLNPL